MWNSEFKDQLCPWGQTNRAGKQEATGAAGPGIKGSRGGRRWVQACRSPESGSAVPAVSSVGIVCLPLSIVPPQRVRGRKEEKHRGCQGRWDSSTQEVLSPAGPSHSRVIISPPPYPHFTKAAEVSPIKAVASLSHPRLAPGPRRPPRLESKGNLVLGGCLRRERRVLSGPQTLRHLTFPNTF